MSNLGRGRLGAVLLVLGSVAASAVGCGGGGGGGGGAGAGAGSARIRTTGGDGTAGDAGSGGSIFLLGRPGGDVSVTRGGAVDASFSVPDLRPYVGSNPRIFDAGASLTLTGDPLTGSVDSTREASGLIIGAGATVTLHTPAPPTGSGDVQPPVQLTFEHGVIVEGALRTGTEGLQISAENVLIAATGEVASEGFRESLSLSDFGSVLSGGQSGILIQCRGSIVNEGRITARGESGEVGGGAGAVALVSAAGILSTGVIDATGGDGTSGPGGSGGLVAATLGEGLGFVGVSGELRARGGDGATAGGAGGLAFLVNAGLGSLASSAAIDVEGGSGAGVTLVSVTLPEESEPVDVTRSGGPAGTVILVASTTVRVTGGIRAAGGLSTSPSPEAPGGAGGTILLASNAGGALLLSVDMDTRGGAGSKGGTGGPVLLFSSLEGLGGSTQGGEVDTPSVLLAGYGEIEASGGASRGGKGGTAAGNLAGNLFGLPLGALGLPGIGELTGDGGGLIVMLGQELGGNGGGVSLDVDVTARGGASTVSGTAGGVAGGGPLLLLGSVPEDFVIGGDGGGAETIAVAAALRVASGSPGGGFVAHGGRLSLEGGGGVAGGNGGAFVALAGGAGIRSAGDLHLGGGAATEPSTTTPTGGRGGLAMLITQGPIERSGAARASGGAAGATGAGGEGGVVLAVGTRVRWTGDVECRGGAGATGGAGGHLDGVEVMGELLPLASDLGAEGGIIFLSSEATSDVSGALSAEGGAGSTGDGAPGRILIDGHEVAPASGAAVLP